jgi:hypothetical protein
MTIRRIKVPATVTLVYDDEEHDQNGALDTLLEDISNAKDAEYLPEGFSVFLYAAESDVPVNGG